MFLKKIKTPKGLVYLQIVEGYRNEQGKSSHRVVEKLGYLEDLSISLNKSKEETLKYYEDYAKTLSKEKRENLNISLASTAEMNKDETKVKNVGYLALKPIIEKLELKKICDVFNTKYNSEYSFYDILSFLIYSKTIYAGSRRSSYIKKGTYFENYEFSEDQLYRSMTPLGESWEQIKDAVFRKTKENFGINTEQFFYDGTNFYFEIDQQDDFRKKGPSKEKRVEPLVSVGLLLDANYFPIDIKIYPGNENESVHFNSVIRDMKKNKKIDGKTIYIADKGLNTGNNIFECIKNKDGYIYSMSIKKLDEKHKKYIFNSEEFTDVWNLDNKIKYSYKSAIFDDVIIKFDFNGKKQSHTVKQRWVVTYSEESAKKARYERNLLINKAKKMIKTPGEYDRKRLGDASAYVKKIEYDKNGEIIETKSILELNLQKIEEEEKYDGYYLIVTSELKMKPLEIIRAYRNLWHIENSFRVEKTYLKLRPAYVSREERIKCHVLVSYLSLLVLRLLQNKILNNKYSLEEIITSLREYDCCEISKNIYFFFQYNRIVEELGEISRSNARLEAHNLSEIRKLFRY